MSSAERQRPSGLYALSATELRDTLVVGNIARWSAEGRFPAPLANIGFIDLPELTKQKFAEVQPTLILSPLFGRHFDAIDVANCLKKLDFSGKYRAVTHEMPDLDMIRYEVRMHAPGLDFDVLSLGPG